jgi:transcriptional regulator with XRE-family HTH domain
MSKLSPIMAREILGLNQGTMAAAMGVHRNTWGKWEREEQRITAAPSRLIEVFLWLQSRGLLADYLRSANVLPADAPNKARTVIPSNGNG